ncbi:hypothetical protein ZIOFF_070883 [Zingiber officinale]|uniref:GRAM domain-containing protein n=1 Tax=Zingiber officinale TaxID=94328 RepID=A0A8J5C8X9_ZINOF|nr:hypothetical protein ZIOFF_070883 [Zingiber officinale]
MLYSVPVTGVQIAALADGSLLVLEFMPRMSVSGVEVVTNVLEKIIEDVEDVNAIKYDSNSASPPHAPHYLATRLLHMAVIIAAKAAAPAGGPLISALARNPSNFRMKHTNLDQVAGLPLRLVRYGAEAAAKFVAVSELNRICLHSDSCDGSRYKQRSKISETVKGKLSLGAKILQAGGVQRVFRQSFTVEKGEKLLHAFQCYLSTTAGPIAGLLFVSINKIAFCSDQSIRITSPEGSLVRVPYKVLIPLGKRSLKHLRRAISASQLEDLH